MCYKTKLTTLLTLFPILLFGQTGKFKWVNESCEFEGVFDTKKYTRVQIENTYKLWFSLYFRLETDATPWTISNISELSVDKLEKEYQKKYAELIALDIVNQEFWQILKNNQLTEINQLYKLKKLTILGFSNPGVLSEYRGADSCINKYVQALEAGGELLLKTWEELNRVRRLKNGLPNKVEERFMREFNSPDKYRYAQLEVMKFGWWNCANSSISYVSSEDSERMFNKLFKTIKTIECDDVD